MYYVTVCSPSLSYMQPPPGVDAPLMDTAEIVYISSLALLKVRKIIQSWLHARAHVRVCACTHIKFFPFNPCTSHISYTVWCSTRCSSMVSLALYKMYNTFIVCRNSAFFHTGRAGVPMEVMGLMLGEFVDDYTVRVIDVFAMPQSGTVGRLV